MSSAAKSIRIVIAGSGRFGSLHARVWAEAGASVVGLCDVDEEALRAAADANQVQHTGTHLAELIQQVQADAVVIATDEASHVQLALEALRLGCHVFVEKPLALSGADAWRIHQTAQDTGLQVVAGQISRFAAPYARMLTSLNAGRIGRLCAVRLRRDFSREWFLSFGDRVHPVWESCIHDIDLAVAYVRQPVKRVSAVQSIAAGKGAKSVVSALMEFEGGAIATIESAWVLPRSAPQTLAGALELEGSIVGEAELLGTDGVLRQRLVSDGLVEWTSDGAFVPDLSLWPEEEGHIGGALRREVDYAIGLFTGAREPDRVPLEEVCWGVSAAEAMVTALDTAAWVDVPAKPDGPL